MKNTERFFLNLKTSSITLLSLLIFISCSGQVDKNKIALKYKVEQIKVHEDSISIKAEGLPEFKISPHDKDYQGNQISGVVRTVFQDKKGDFWFGTQNGLCRKNQNGLVYYDLKDSNGQGVTVYAILEDKKGNIWIGYGGGIAKYDGTFFTNYYQKEILTVSGLWSMMIDSNGILWLGTTQGVFTFEGEKLVPFAIPEGKIDTSKGVSTSKMVHSIMEDSKGNIWFATNGGAYVFDGDTLTNLSKKYNNPSNFVNQIIERTNGNYLISTSGGLYEYDGNSLYNRTEKLLGKNSEVGCLLEDKSGTIWFTANKRNIYSFKGETFQKNQIKEGEFSPLPFQIYEDQQNRLWFVGFKGAYRLEKNCFINITRFGPW
jgi:ligand-binding sensor domain-containing protein